MSETQAPVYLQCSVCGFWVTKEQGSCPNCGVIWPQSSWKPFTVPMDATGAVVIAGIGVLTALASAAAIGLLGAVAPGSPLVQDLTQWIAAVSIGAGSVVSAAFGGLVGLNYFLFRRPRPRDCFQEIERGLLASFSPPQSLRQSEQQLVERIDELKNTGQETTQLEAALASVRNALEVTSEQVRRARVVLEKIALLRWQNKLEPLLMASPAAPHPEEWKRRLRQLSGIQEEGRALAKLVAQQQLPEARELEAMWDQMLKACERLENEMLARQAVAAIESVQATEVETTSGATLPAHMALREFLIAHDFGDLDTSLKDLRREEARLQADRSQTEQAARQMQIGN